MAKDTDTPEVENEEVVETSVEETKVPVSETTETETTEETPVKAETTEEEFDVEEFKRSTVEEAQKAVVEKIAAGLGLTKEEKKQVEDEGKIPPWEKEGRTPKSYKEVAEYSADLAEWKRDQKEKEIANIQKDNENEAKEVGKRWNDYWDTELDELTKINKIPAVKDENDPNDPGKKARIKLFAKMQELGLQRQKDGLPPITSVKLIYYEHYDDGEPGGADAPVSFGKKGVSSSGEGDDYSYSEIRGKNFDQIKRGD